MNKSSVALAPGDRVKVRCRYLIYYHADYHWTNGLTGTVMQIEPALGKHSHHVQFDHPIKGTFADLTDAWYRLDQLTKIDEEPTNA